MFVLIYVNISCRSHSQKIPGPCWLIAGSQLAQLVSPDYQLVAVYHQTPRDLLMITLPETNSSPLVNTIKMVDFPWLMLVYKSVSKHPGSRIRNAYPLLHKSWKVYWFASSCNPVKTYKSPSVEPASRGAITSFALTHGLVVQQVKRPQKNIISLIWSILPTQTNRWEWNFLKIRSQRKNVDV